MQNKEACPARKITVLQLTLSTSEGLHSAWLRATFAYCWPAKVSLVGLRHLPAGCLAGNTPQC